MLAGHVPRLPYARAWPWQHRLSAARLLGVGSFHLLIPTHQLWDLLTGAPIFLVSNSFIRLYLHPSCLLDLLYCSVSLLCRMFSSFIFSLSGSVIKTFKAVNSPPTPTVGAPDVSAPSVWL